MKQIGFSLIIVAICLGCGTSNHIASETVYDAKSQISSAKEVEAQGLAAQELAEAEEIFSQAEAALGAEKEKEAHRLGMRAYLKAKVAETIAIANRMEAEARAAEEELELKLQAVEAAHRDLEQAEDELEQSQSTPETQ